MNRLAILLAVIGLVVVTTGVATLTRDAKATVIDPIAQDEAGHQEKKQGAKKAADLDKLYKMIRKARADLKSLYKKAGIKRERREEHGRREGRGEHGRREGRGEHGRREGRGEHRGREGREGRGEHAGREGREGRGEHGGRREGRGEHGKREGRERGEEGGQRLPKNAEWNAVRNGAHLILKYDAASRSFKGTVQNTTKKTLSEVRVEVHLSNGRELGPTKRVDLKPGAKIAVELAAGNKDFEWWTTHPETGSEEGHGPGHEAGREGRGNRPNDPALRPIYNQLRLLNREIAALSKALAKKMKK